MDLNIKTNSELPLCLLEHNLELNDMDFVLFHLYSTNEQYRDYYKRLRVEHPERIMIFDNSAYEYYVKGESVDLEKFAEAINDLLPDYYLLPDTLMDFSDTIHKSSVFVEVYSGKINPKCKPMGVLQGMESSELLTCADIYKTMGIQNICIPFHNKFFATYAGHEVRTKWKEKMKVEQLTLDMEYAAGRVEWIDKHWDELMEFDYVHMLGSHNPFEKKLVKLIAPSVVQSMDTGYPVKVGYEGHELFKEPAKPNVIIDDFLEEDLPQNIKELIIKNVKTFKKL